MPSTPPPAAPTAGSSDGLPYGLTAEQVALWEHVNTCEESGVWTVDGSQYAGGLGWTHASWDQFGVPMGFGTDAAQASEYEQIAAAVQFAIYYWGSPNAAPDTNGCAGY